MRGSYDVVVMCFFCACHIPGSMVQTLLELISGSYHLTLCLLQVLQEAWSLLAATSWCEAMSKPSDEKKITSTSQFGGKLSGKVPGDPLDFDLFDAEGSLESLFGSLSGAALLEQLLVWFQDGEPLDVPWYSEENARNLIRHPSSQEIQESTVTRYQIRILSEGLSQVVSGVGLVVDLT